MNQQPARTARIIDLLKAKGESLQELYTFADKIRRRHVGQPVHVRGIIEFSNDCGRNCLYCGIRRANQQLERYTLDRSEIISVARRAREFDYGTIVLQSGEPAPFEPDELCEIIREIKSETGLAITLSCGVYPEAVYEQFARAGCDRYLLRFETSNRQLFNRLHPEVDYEARLEALEAIRGAGLQVGSGFMIGLPGATLEDLARDIQLTTQLKLDMIGCGPYLPAAETPLGETAGEPLLEPEIYYKTMALLRILNPLAHLPATTAFDTLAADGRNRVLRRGGNVFMPNLTPGRYRRQYQLYPDKPCVDEAASRCAGCVKHRLRELDRPLATGPGHTLRPN